MTKVQLTLTPQEASLLSQQAAVLGYNRTKFIKFLISRAAFSTAQDFPVHTLSLQEEKLAEQAIKDHEQGKSLELESIDKLDDL